MRRAADAEEAQDEAAEELYITVSGKLWDKMEGLAGEIAENPARSWAGVAAKAACVKYAVDQVAEALEDGHCILVIVPGMMNDILRLAGGTTVDRSPRQVEV
jgi:hypothetical protein